MRHKVLITPKSSLKNWLQQEADLWLTILAKQTDRMPLPDPTSRALAPSCSWSCNNSSAYACYTHTHTKHRDINNSSYGNSPTVCYLDSNDRLGFKVWCRLCTGSILEAILPAAVSFKKITGEKTSNCSSAGFYLTAGVLSRVSLRGARKFKSRPWGMNEVWKHIQYIQIFSND